jgi:hypothetical protein
MEEVEDEDDIPANVAPTRSSSIIELDDDDDDCPLLVGVDSDDEDDDDEETDGEEPEESAEAELGQFVIRHSSSGTHTFTDRLSSEWTSPIYVFFEPTPKIEYIKERCVHVFECSATRCMGKGNGRMVRRYLDTGDAKSTSNLRKHAKICWGKEAVAAVDSTRDVHTAQEALGKMKLVDSSITAAFECASKAKVSYSHRQHNTTKTR